MIENLEDVILFASLAHKNQKMTDPDVPYLTHVMGVASNVLEAYYNGEEKFDLDYALKVAILHDTIEDTIVAYEDIEKRYGEEIAEGVLALSKNEEIEKAYRMDDCISRIKKCRKEVAIVKLADRTFNMRCRPATWDEEHCKKYNQEAKKIYDELAVTNEYLAKKLSERISRYLVNDREDGRRKNF